MDLIVRIAITIAALWRYKYAMEAGVASGNDDGPNLAGRRVAGRLVPSLADGDTGSADVPGDDCAGMVGVNEEG